MYSWSQRTEAIAVDREEKTISDGTSFFCAGKILYSMWIYDLIFSKNICDRFIFGVCDPATCTYASRRVGGSDWAQIIDFLIEKWLWETSDAKYSSEKRLFAIFQCKRGVPEIECESCPTVRCNSSSQNRYFVWNFVQYYHSESRSAVKFIKLNVSILFLMDIAHIWYFHAIWWNKKNARLVGVFFKCQTLLYAACIEFADYALLIIIIIDDVIFFDDQKIFYYRKRGSNSDVRPNEWMNWATGQSLEPAKRTTERERRGGGGEIVKNVIKNSYSTFYRYGWNAICAHVRCDASHHLRVAELLRIINWFYN